MRESGVHGSAGSTTSSFLDSLKQRDDAAWRRLASVYARLVLDWCRSAGVPSAERTDVCQDVFRAVAANIDGFRYNPPDGTFRGWLCTIAAGSSSTTRMWDAATGRQLAAVRGNRRMVRGACSDPDDKRLATACDDGAAIT